MIRQLIIFVAILSCFAGCSSSSSLVGDSEPLALPPTIAKIDYLKGDAMITGSYGSAAGTQNVLKYGADTDSEPDAIYAIDTAYNITEATLSDGKFYVPVPAGKLYALVFKYGDDYLSYTDLTTGLHSVPLALLSGAESSGEFETDSTTETSVVTVIDVGSISQGDTGVVGESASTTFSDLLGVDYESLSKFDKPVSRFSSTVQKYTCTDTSDPLCGSKNDFYFMTFFTYASTMAGLVNNYLDPASIEFDGYGAAIETFSQYLLNNYTIDQAFLVSPIDIITKGTTYPALERIPATQISGDWGQIYGLLGGADENMVTAATGLLDEELTFTVVFDDGENEHELPFTMTPPTAINPGSGIPVFSYSFIDSDADGYIEELGWKWMWYQDGAWAVMTPDEVKSVVQKIVYDDAWGIVEIRSCDNVSQPIFDIGINEGGALAEGTTEMPAVVDADGDTVAPKFYIDPVGNNSTLCRMYMRYDSAAGFQYQFIK